MEKMQISDGMEGGGAQRFITRLLLNLLMNTSIFDRPLGGPPVFSHVFWGRFGIFLKLVTLFILPLKIKVFLFATFDLFIVFDLIGCELFMGS